MDDQLIKRLDQIQDSIDSVMVNQTDNSIPLDLENHLRDLRGQMEETLKRLDNIEAHMGIVPQDEVD